ncbi:hypothetical protein KIN20_033894 [Parelaphostrongylus tenuis]|uniref:Uncharacterized protein n=1 Tax=Parelaphostrongylus tenuis TaxID=148309 RepID=A0AAD5RBC9_PARTN|nr:hypothetical protein KIN20_033894 [Parelaphostrongylus tenuis]
METATQCKKRSEWLKERPLKDWTEENKENGISAEYDAIENMWKRWECYLQALKRISLRECESFNSIQCMPPIARQIHLCLTTPAKK